ncbi:hypothetical protein OG339_48645 (plasmid) [Streptosporangium sp. NBC_01495]|uniref:hypothetical protein n=1 Tax=Streptosporangium sp. NBC_01495 TaxID=2903899 RepID=UPI002E35020D|nr:hypothetical protein [Streptosporangium sp. NBC_01495]
MSPSRAARVFATAVVTAASLSFGLAASPASASAVTSGSAAAACASWSNFRPANAKSQDDGVITLRNSCATPLTVRVYFSAGGLVMSTVCAYDSDSVSLPWESKYYRSPNRPSLVTSQWASGC